MNAYLFITAFAIPLLAVYLVVMPLAEQSRVRIKGMARLPLLVAIVVVIFSVGLYAVLGRPDVALSTLDGNASHTDTRRPRTTAAKTSGVDSVANLVAGLEERLKSEPDDAKGWLLLAKTYQHLGRNDDAKSAYEKAIALGQTDAAFADSLTSASASTPAPVKTVAEIRGRVSLSEAAMAMVNADDSVFIFAKAVNGPPMPLAVIRQPVADLPFEFVLSDAQSMVQGSELSTVDKVIVTAKISTPKDALRSSPGLEVHSEPVSTISAPHFELVIGSSTDPGMQ